MLKCGICVSSTFQKFGFRFHILVTIIININDLHEILEGRSKLFADDSKLPSILRDEQDVNNLQRDLWSICEWSRVWQMELNVDKFKVIHFGRTNNRDKY